MVTEIALSSFAISEILICSDRNPSDSEFADDFMLLGEDLNQSQVFSRFSESWYMYIWDAFCTSEMQNPVTELALLEDEPCSCLEKIG